MDIAARVREIARPLARAEGVDILDVTFAREGRNHVLRLTVERNDGSTTVGDCAAISRAIGEAIDTQNAIDHAYRLEVSSAGATRQLKTLSDFEKSIGRLVRIDVLKGRSGPVVGTITAADESGITVETGRNGSCRIDLSEIASAHREVQFHARRPKGSRNR